MSDIEKVLNGLKCCSELNSCSQCCPYDDDDDDFANCTAELTKDALELLKEKDELIRKLQKDKDKLCLEVSEWKHKYHDRPLKEQEPVPVYESKISKCACGNIVNRYYHPKFCGCCGKELMWY